MAIKQTRDVLEYVRKFHKKLSQLYHNLGDHTDKERLKMLLDYLSRHEEHIGACVGEYEASASKRILDCWLQCAPDMEMADIAKEMEEVSRMSVDDVIGLAVKWDDFLIDLYNQAAESAESKHAKDIFKKLLEMEDQEKHQLVRQAIRLNDI